MTTTFDQEYDRLMTSFSDDLRALFDERLRETLANLIGHATIGATSARPNGGSARSGYATRTTRTTRTTTPTTPTKRKIIVNCPVEGCTNKGIRTLSNFCVEHNKSVGAREKKRLRDAQKKGLPPPTAKAVPPTAKKAAPPTAKAKPKKSKANELKRAAATRPVMCPAPDCKNPGVRRHKNFCVEHYTKLSKSEMTKLRDAQKKQIEEPAKDQPRAA